MSPGHHPSYHTRDYRPGDEIAITELFGKVFGACLTEAHWRWKYTGAGLTLPLARLAFDSDGRLVGHAGAIALRGWRQGRYLPFLQICDVMVHPAARWQLGQRNLFTRLARELLEEIAQRWPEAFAYGFPGRRPFRLGEYAGVYEEVERTVCLSRPVSKRRLPLPGTRALDWNDGWLDAFWTEQASTLPLALARDRAYLDWRYARHPHHRYQLLGLQLAGLRFGWAVVQPIENRLRVVDLLVARHWLKPALRALDRVAGAIGLQAVEIWLPSGWRETVDGVLEPTEVVAANMIWRLPLRTATVREELYYTMGDLDIF
ncbi:MAG: GNAT family N-acetyltransferase [Candidatus Competibacteraceae bacterium]|nr:GNAT family N-acetyltransferase [Candidatus Competibacteraceae bacterium]